MSGGAPTLPDVEIAARALCALMAPPCACADPAQACHRHLFEAEAAAVVGALRAAHRLIVPPAVQPSAPASAGGAGERGPEIVALPRGASILTVTEVPPTVRDWLWCMADDVWWWLRGWGLVTAVAVAGGAGVWALTAPIWGLMFGALVFGFAVGLRR